MEEQRRGSPQFPLPLIVLVICCAFPERETSKLRITRQLNGPELSNPLVVGTRQPLTIYCAAVNTDGPETLQGLHWRFPNNSRVPGVRQLSEYDVGMFSYLDNNTWIGLLRMDRTQLSYAGIYTCVADFSGMPKNRSMEIQVTACSEPGALTNGRLRLTNSTTVKYTCDSGYSLRGPSTRHCTANNEKLTGSVPQCIQVPSQVTGLSLSKAVLSRLPALWANWIIPQSDEPISQFILQYRKHGTTPWGSQSSTTQNSTIVPSLAAGTEYDVRVRAESAVGDGMWSAVQTERTYMKPPSPNHDTVSAVPVNRRGVIRVTWTAPTVPRGELSITGYSILYKVQNSSVFKYWSGTSNSETEVTGLNYGTVYRVYVAGVSAIGRGSYCCDGTPVLVRTYNVPFLVAGGAVSKAIHSGKPALRVTWTTPQSDVTISQYQVVYRRQGTSSWRKVVIVATISTPSTLLEALDVGTVYEVRIRAVSVIGNGAWGRVESATTYMPPSQVTGVAVFKATRSGKPALSVTWTAPQSHVTISQYQVEYKKRSTDWRAASPVSPGSATSTLLEALDAGTAYEVRIRAVSAIGSGPWSRVVSGTTDKTTPQPTLRLVNSTMQSLSISWSVTSPQDVSHYMMFWWKESAEISKSVALDDTTFVIEGLLSNTAYHVVVLASGPLGNVNSTSKVFYTAPNKVQGSLSVLVFPAQLLQVSWKPSEDAARSLIEYIVNTTAMGMNFANLTSVKHPITSVPISGLPQYSSGTVSVWVKNPGALSKAVVLRFRMVNIVTNVIEVSAEWVDAGFTSLRVTVPEGVLYRVSYWAVNKSTGPELKVATTSSSSQVISDFSPDYIYTIVVEDWTGRAERDEESNGVCTVEDNNAATAGSFLGGLVAGGICVVLVVGIVLGLVKLRKQRKGAESAQEEKKTEATYETVGPKESAALSEHVAMETNPAYASVH